MTETQSLPGLFAYAGISKVHFYGGNIFPGFVPFFARHSNKACMHSEGGRGEQKVIFAITGWEDNVL